MIIEIPSLEQSKRADVYLCQHFPNSSRKHWRENWKVWIEAIKTEPEPESGPKKYRIARSHLLQGKESLIIDDSCLNFDQFLAPNADIILEILFEHSDFFIVYKKAQQHSAPIRGKEANSIVNAVLAHNPSGAQIKEAGLINRLDYETSGLLIFAKNLKSYEELKKQQEENLITKKYWAVVEGQVKADCEIASGFFQKSKRAKRVYVDLTQQSRSSQIRVLGHGTCQDKEVSVIEVSLTRGSRHQIRCQLSSIGHPLWGDELYEAESHDQPFLLHNFSVNIAQDSHWGPYKNHLDYIASTGLEIDIK